jgi:erythrocyte band 7 integral membrane protein
MATTGVISTEPIRQAAPGALTQVSFAMENPDGYTASNDACYEGMLTCLGFVFGTLGSLPGCCCFPNPFKQVAQGTVGLVSKFGRFVRAVDPGLYKVNPFCEQLRVVDVRTQVENIPRQSILTKDNVSVSIESVLYWSIISPFTATFLVSNVEKALIDRTQTTLRMVLVDF